MSDDISGILQNKNIGDLSAVFSHPISFLRDLFYYFIYKIGGLNPIYFRLLNICLHLGSTWLIFAILSLLFNPTVGLFTASVFAVHPLQSEAITWISGGPYSQYSFFLLLSFLLYIIYGKKHSFKFYILSLISFLLSLLSTEKGAVYPLFLFLYEYSFNNINFKNTWKKILPFFALSALWFLLFLTQGAIGGRMTTLQANYYQPGGLENPLIQIPVAISSYLNLIFVPIGLTLYHSEEMVLNNFAYAARLTVFLIFIFSIFYSFRKNKKVFFWLSFFFISLWPVLTPLKISWIVAERYVYLGSLGIYVVVALLAEKLGKIDKNPKVPYFLLAMILPILGILTIIRNAEWKNQDTLWLATAKTSPSSPQNHNNLGDYYFRQGNLEQAVKEFTIATQLKPNYGDAYHNLGNVYHQIGKLKEALENYEKALQFNPNLWQTHQNLAAVYFELKDYNQAVNHIKKVISIYPSDSKLYTVLGMVYLQAGDKNNAKLELEQALKLNPQDQKAKQLLLSL